MLSLYEKCSHYLKNQRSVPHSRLNPAVGAAAHARDRVPHGVTMRTADREAVNP